MPSRGPCSRSFPAGVVCVKFNREGVATVGKGARRLCTNARQARSYQPLQVQEYTQTRLEKHCGEPGRASSPCTDKSATTAKAFATREYKPQGLEENLASSACAISAIKLCTDDCGCHPRTVRALVASPHRWTGSAGRKRCSSERTYRCQSSPRLAKAVCAISRTECVVPLARIKSSAVE